MTMMTRRVFVRRGATALAGAAMLGEFAQLLAQAAPGAKIRLGSRTNCFGGDYKVAKQCGIEDVNRLSARNYHGSSLRHSGGRPASPACRQA